MLRLGRGAVGRDLQRLRPPRQEVPQVAQGLNQELAPRRRRKIRTRHQELGQVQVQETPGSHRRPRPAGNPGKGPEAKARLQEETQAWPS